jgi:type I restriction enzyme M protein
VGRQNAPEFAKLFDDTLRDIAISNNDIFAVKTDGGAKITLFDRVSEFITDTSKRDAFCRAIINKLGDFSFERIFNEKYDFYAALFEYLIKDYNKDSGGKYAEYYTPHAVAKIMAAILVPEAVRGKVSNVSCYDPSAGSGTLLMNIAHAIGEQRCSIYSQDISQKSSSLLRLNLILNNLVHSIPNIIQGNTMLHPYHREAQGQGKKTHSKSLTTSSAIRRSRWISAISAMSWTAKSTANAFLPGCPISRSRPWTKWPSTSSSCSTSFIP